MRPCIKKYKPEEEFYIDEGCYITELSNSEDDLGLSIARARVLPGVTTKLHKLIGTVERYVILEGEGLVEIGDQLHKLVTAFDVVIIPADCPQKIRNTGLKDLIFLVLCTPAFTKDCYIEI